MQTMQMKNGSGALPQEPEHPDDRREKNKGIFDMEERGGYEHDGQGSTPQPNPLAPYPKTVL